MTGAIVKVGTEPDPAFLIFFRGLDCAVVHSPATAQSGTARLYWEWPRSSLKRTDLQLREGDHPKLSQRPARVAKNLILPPGHVEESRRLPNGFTIRRKRREPYLSLRETQCWGADWRLHRGVIRHRLGDLSLGPA